MAELIISDVRPRVQYTADGVQTNFPYPFPILDQADLVVVFDDNEAPGANSVSGVGLSAGGDVEFDSPPPLATRITIYRDMAFARETDFQEAGDFRAAVINEELDRMAMLLQQGEMLVADSVHKPLYEADSDLVLPSATARAGKVLTFDKNGLPAVGSPSEEAATLAATSAAAAAASATLAQTEADYVLNTAVPVQQLSGDGATVAFVLDRSVVDSTSIAVSIDGIKQHTATYGAVGAALTFTAAPPTGASNIEVTFIGATGLVANLGGGAFGGTRNRIVNGNFAVNQRGVSGTVVLGAGVYGHDRFKAGASGCTYTFATSLNVTTITITAGSLQQAIEGGNLFSEPMVLSWAGTCQGKIGAGAYAASGVSATVTCGAALTVEFNTGTLSLVQFEVGSVATPFEHRAAALEVALCQRFYETVGFVASQAPVANGFVRDATHASGIWVFKVTKRVSPSIAYAGVAGDYDVAHGNTYLVTTSLGALGSGLQSFELYWAVAGGLPVGQGCLLRITSSGGKVIADAEI